MECVCCKGNLSKIFTLGNQPLANKYPKEGSNFESEYIQEMNVFKCDSCGYCHVPCDADRNLFFEDYYYLSSFSGCKEHFTNLAKDLKEKGAKFVLDVGSNDGIFLKPLKDLDVKFLGVDPSHNVGEIANSKGLETMIGFFNSEIADRIIKEKGHPDVIVACSVFTHLEDPGYFFNVCDKLLDEGGSILIEVEFLNDIIETLSFERFYYDRPHYYTVESLREISLRYGFDAVRVDHIETHGGQLRIKFQRIRDIENKSDLSTNQFMSLSSKEILYYFGEFQEACKELKNQLIKFKKKGVSIGGFCSPARLSTITNFAKIGPELLPFVIDDTPLKQGRYTPGKHIPIIPNQGSPKVENYLVFASQYIETIRSKVPNKEVNFYKPIPFTKL